MENQTLANKKLEIRYPNFKIGYVFSFLSFIGFLMIFLTVRGIVIDPAGISINYLAVICFAGLIYWCRCVYCIHRILKKISGGEIPCAPSQAVLHLLIPLYNIYWSFVWIRNIARCLGKYQHDKKVKVFVSGLFLAFSVMAPLYFFPVFLLGSVLVFSYLVKNIRETVAFDEAGQQTIAANVSKWQAQPKNTSRRTGKLLVIIAVVIILIAFCNLPRITTYPVFREGLRLVPLLEDYKKQRGTYPDRLEQLGIEIKYYGQGALGIRYRTTDEGSEFILGCSGIWTSREVYDSKTKTWKHLD